MALVVMAHPLETECHTTTQNLFIHREVPTLQIKPEYWGFQFI